MNPRVLENGTSHLENYANLLLDPLSQANSPSHTLDLGKTIVDDKESIKEWDFCNVISLRKSLLPLMGDKKALQRTWMD